MQKTKRILYSAEEVAEMTGLSVRQIWGLCRRRQIAFHRINREYRFSQEQIDGLLQSTLVTPDDELRPIGA